jgi:uncharacterized FAD-dependent dehydrogenase
MIVELLLGPIAAADPATVRSHALEQAGLADSPTAYVHVTRRSIDARSRRPLVRLRLEVSAEQPPTKPAPLTSLREADPTKRVVIVGAGPAGYFAAIELLRHGITPVVLDRGKDVRARRRDLRALMQDGIVNPHSNYCFGEGGAGTYSDGKLYTRAHKRGNVQDVLELLVAHGASADILVDAHPHVGSNKLWAVVQNIRETILRFGGEVRFNAFVTKFIIWPSAGGRQPTASIQQPSANSQRPTAVGVVLDDGTEVRGDAVILATGHSARDIFDLCIQSGVAIEVKPFALGVRIEHPQALIDEMQYHQSPRDPYLPASSYALTCQSDGRGVFSFCMCPGGIIVPSATAPGEIVVNGMSMSRRDSEFANSGLVVEVTGGLALQRAVEQAAFNALAGGSQQAPAQRADDFVAGRVSSTLPATSYIPGIATFDLRCILPAEVSARIADALKQFNTKMPGYLTNEAVLVAPESRTSSPFRMPRDPSTLESASHSALYPCGEGAGYAGGIMSAALDGQRVARAIAELSRPLGVR